MHMIYQVQHQNIQDNPLYQRKIKNTKMNRFYYNELDQTKQSISLNLEQQQKMYAQFNEQQERQQQQYVDSFAIIIGDIVEAFCEQNLTQFVNIRGFDETIAVSLSLHLNQCIWQILKQSQKQIKCIAQDELKKVIENRALNQFPKSLLSQKSFSKQQVYQRIRELIRSNSNIKSIFQKISLSRRILASQIITRVTSQKTCSLLSNVRNTLQDIRKAQNTSLIIEKTLKNLLQQESIIEKNYSSKLKIIENKYKSEINLEKWRFLTKKNLKNSNDKFNNAQEQHKLNEEHIEEERNAENKKNKQKFDFQMRVIREQIYQAEQDLQKYHVFLNEFGRGTNSQNKSNQQ